MTTLEMLLYSDAFWAAVAVGSFALLIVGIVADLIKTKPRRIT